jgi:hypothetical protein
MVSWNALTRIHLGRVSVIANFIPVIAAERQSQANDVLRAYGQFRGSAGGIEIN